MKKSKDLKLNIRRDAITGILFCSIGFLLGYLVFESPEIMTISKRANDPKLAFTNPLLSCGISENKEFSEYKSLEGSISTVISTRDPKKEDTVSVYYRDLNTGRWFGVNETEEYSPASLLKVPIMIAYFKEAENDPAILSKQLYYGSKATYDNNIEYYKSKKDITTGNYYTVDELITSMIEHSDNAATVLLFNEINNNSLVEVMTDIGLRPSSNQNVTGTDDYMTVKSYSYLFRLLYNSTYLNRSMSEKALKLLSYSDFNQGIDGGLPSGIKAAQKFGERTIANLDTNTTERELHDCGIIYYPKHPYLLCIMTKGKDFDSLSNIIQNISKAVYNQVQNSYGNN